MFIISSSSCSPGEQTLAQSFSLLAVYCDIVIIIIIIFKNLGSCTKAPSIQGSLVQGHLDWESTNPGFRR